MEMMYIPYLFLVGRFDHGSWLQSLGGPSTIVRLKPRKTTPGLRSPKSKGRNSVPVPASEAFRGGTVVVITLNEPREKVWGVLLALDPAGVSVQGIDLSAFEDATRAVVEGEPLGANALFFPMHRVERIQLDLPEGTIPSLSQRFQSRTGLRPEQVLLASMQNHARSNGE
jgi:hypothetical protein